MHRRFYLYAAKRLPAPADIARYCRRPWDRAALSALPTGVLVGSATIVACTRGREFYEWHLSDVRRLRRPIRPTGRPQPIWWTPF